MKNKPAQKSVASSRPNSLILVLQARFEEHPQRHKGLSWDKVLDRLTTRPDKLRALGEMERTGGEPDVVGVDKKTGEILFVDCSPESPKGRRSVCFDRAALDSRKEHKPATSALDLAAEIGVELLTETQYRDLQKLGEFDLATSSWVQTPPAIRELGGALFCDRRYGAVFVYHNGAQSYYAARAFRGMLRV